MNELTRDGLFFVLGLLTGLLLALGLGTFPSSARDLGQWEQSDPAVREWFQSLMQPDVPEASCCGPADGYYCDDISVKEGKTYCRITDTRPDAPLARPHVAVGTLVQIPANKLGHYPGNPTGHSIVFLSSAGYVYCFVQQGGV